MNRTALIGLSLFAVCLTVCTGAFGQSKKTDETASLLYKVSGNGITKPSYIFGTFHAICPVDMVPFETLDTYIGDTDQMMLEIDMDDAAEMQSMAKGVIIADGKTLKDFLNAEKFAVVDKMMKDLLGYSAENVKMVKPTLLTVMALTSPKAIGCTPTTYDMELMRKASAKRKPVVGLETVASQLLVLDSKPTAEQAEDLYKTAADTPKAINELKKMVAAYKTRDSEKVFKVANSGLAKDKKFQVKLLDDRNRAWIPKLESAFKDKPTFVAVGAGHLGGKNGVVKLLRKRGYQVTPVMLGTTAAGDN